MNRALGAFLPWAVGACVATLPFDELSGGPLRPTSYFPLEQTSGDIVPDSFRRHDGVLQKDNLNGARWVSGGRRGGGLEFPDNDGWIRFASLSSGRDGTFPLRATVALWAKMRTFDVGGEGSLMFFAEDLKDPNNIDDDITPFSLLVNERQVILELGGDGEVLLRSTAVPLDRWVLFAFGWDIPKGEAFLYVRPEGEPAHAIVRGKLPPRFDVSNSDFNVSGWRSTIDDVRFYDRPLFDTDLNQID